MILPRLAFLLTLCLSSLTGVSTISAQETARFTVSQEVINADLPPFTATIGTIGNGSRLSNAGGFEPAVFRTKLRVSQDAPNTIIASPSELTNYDSWRDGALDGAEVEVLRIEDGKFVSVRRSIIPKGGYRASGWIAQFSGRVLPKDSTSARISWDRWNQLGVPYYFTVRAVDRHGRLSAEAKAISVTAPENPSKVEPPAGLEKRDLSESYARLSPPQNLRAELKLDRTVELSWDPVKGARGYVIYRSDLPPEEHRGYYIQLADDGAPIKAGDMVLIRKRFFAPKREELLTNRVWSAHQAARDFRQPLLEGFADDPDKPRWSLREHEPNTPVEDAGETYLYVNVTPRAPLTVGHYNHSGTAQAWYEVLDPTHEYMFGVWLRGDPTVTATVRLPDGNRQLSLTENWRKYSLPFHVPELYSDNRPRRIDMLIQGAGQVAVDNFRIYRADAPYLSFLPEDAENLRASGMDELRTHRFIKTFRRTYDLEQFTNPGGAISMAQGNTLPQTLEAFKSVGMSPWLQVEPHFTREEWLGLVEYLAAPFDPETDDPALKPWAAKRAHQGHPAPYTQDFDHIRFEIGNETWNSLFAPWTFSPMQDARTGQKYSAAEVYGLYQAYVLSIFQESPYWDDLEPVLSPVIGGWTINSYGEDAAAMTPETPLVTMGEYNGGWDQGEGVVTETPEGFASVLGFAPQIVVDRATNHIEKAREVAEKRGTPLAVGTYEAGPGYARNGLNNAKVTPEQQQAQERVMKSSAAGAATLDTFLTQARAGYRIQNYFTFGRGDYWKSHALWFHGGQAYPSWQWLTVVNRNGEGLGDLLSVQAQEVPRRDLPGFARRDGLQDAPMVDVYPLLKGDQLMVVVISRLVPDVPRGTDGIADVTISLPFSHAESLTRLSMSGDLRATNVRAPDAMIEQENIPVSTALPRLHIPQLPPGEAEIYVFDGIPP
jgi:hypothetical protein